MAGITLTVTVDFLAELFADFCVFCFANRNHSYSSSEFLSRVLCFVIDKN